MNIMFHYPVLKNVEQESAVQATYFKYLDDMLAKVDCVVLATPFSGSNA